MGQDGQEGQEGGKEGRLRAKGGNGSMDCIMRENSE